MSYIQTWPKPGDKLKFIGAKFAFHSNVLENGKKLVIGNIYTVRSCSPASSWCKITVEELPDTGVHGEDSLSLAFFEILPKE